MNISFTISLSVCFVCSKNRLIETVLLSTHNMFWLRNTENIFSLCALNSVSSLTVIEYLSSGQAARMRTSSLEVWLFAHTMEGHGLSLGQNFEP